MNDARCHQLPAYEVPAGPDEPVYEFIEEREMVDVEVCQQVHPPWPGIRANDAVRIYGHQLLNAVGEAQRKAEGDYASH